MSERKILDKWPVICVLAYLIPQIGMDVGRIILYGVHKLMENAVPAFAASDVWVTGRIYAGFIGVWILLFAIIAVCRKDRYLLKMLSPRVAGNTVKNACIGLAIGFGLNGFCILIAWLNGNIDLEFCRFNFISLIFIFVCVFIQCTAEEIAFRGYIYHKIMKSYGKPVMAVLLSSLIFASGHLFNPGATLLSDINLVSAGVLFALGLCYMKNSLWCACGIHTAWNFSQSIIFGLPNSGILFPYSVFRPDVDTLTDSFAYDVEFGIEGTVLSTSLIIAVCVIWILIARKKNIQPVVLADEI